MKTLHQCCQKLCTSTFYVSNPCSTMKFRHQIGVSCLLSDSIGFLYYAHSVQIHSENSYNLNTSSSSGAWDSRLGVGNVLAVKQTLTVLQFRGSGTGFTFLSGSSVDVGSFVETFLLDFTDLFSVEITFCCRESETITG